MRRTRIITATAIMASAALAAGPGGAASAQGTHPATITCTLELFAQGMPNPTGIQFGLAMCPRPFGNGVHFDTVTVTPTGPGHGAIAGSFKNYFDRGTRTGTVALTYAATSPMNISYTGTVTYTAGTGKFKHLRGSGTIQCTTADAGAHKSCTVTTSLGGA